jgi:hypothetical protein
MTLDFFCIRLTRLGLLKIRKSSSIERKIRTRYNFRYNLGLNRRASIAARFSPINVL